MHRVLLVGGCLFLTIPSVYSQNDFTLCHHATALFTNARFITLNPKQPTVEAVAIRNHRIVALGKEKDLSVHCRDENTRIIDLKGATVTPGLIDTYSQFVLYGWLATHALDLSTTNVFQQPGWQPVKSLSEFLTAIRNKMTTDDSWLVVNGYDRARMPGAPLTRTMLDEISSTKPILVMYSSGHEALLNQAAMDRLPALKSSLPVTVPENGLLKEGALQKALIKVIQSAQLQQAIEVAATRYAAAGYTTVTETQASQDWLNAYYSLTSQPSFPVDVVLNAETVGDKQRFAMNELDNPRLYNGPVRLTVDGNIRDYHAYLSSPYYKVPDDLPTAWAGQLRYNLRTLEKMLVKAARANVQVALECQGDAAIDVALNLIQKVQQTQNDFTFRPILINAQLTRQDQLYRIRMLGLNINWFSPHLYYWGESMCRQYLGAPRALNENPLAQARNILGSTPIQANSPATPPSPLAMMRQNLTRQIQRWNEKPNAQCPDVFNSQQRLSLEDSLRALTIEAAKLYGMDDDKGTLEVGKLADMTLFSHDPLLEKQVDIQVLGTVSRGVLHLGGHAEENPPPQAL
ncbi:hypothetical protein DIZ81_09100 [Legionella taurinensis]|uniref:Amidohydrolase 3 domain-containing protein n=1 Tax=Legionella taurinensis TaxID=70611 RepID=A0AB38N389_9GAMM|nr:amidohydrolase family protein [Legionella taurinensis]MDX1837813.1 amidohydrolase family protein [Legionella taurinensis]PUT39684.1 hypothetical protein DB744_09110 [Legionella taurinensis]PUT43377.1 hypothetical protein DB746_06430 [Legionella taurinensis]PUT45823.1 hypothetical protein DB743_06425 [Legionella taurinensis]PUT47735.1 hypothetical protein DB745_07510 [Legionella taurinensis]